MGNFTILKKDKLGNIFHTTSGGTPSRNNKKFYTGNISWLKSGELNDNMHIDTSEEHINEDAVKNSSAKLFPEKTVLIALYGATTGKLGILEKESTTNQAVCGIFPKEGFLPEFIYYYLLFKRQHLISKAQGGAQPNINQGIVQSLDFPIMDIDTQKIIVSEIEKQFSRLDDSIRSLTSVKNKLEVYKKTILNYAFKNLETKPLMDLCDNFKSDIVDGPFGSDLQRKDYIDSGIPVLKIQNIKPFKIILKKMDYISEDKYTQLKRHSFKPNDIILTKLGEPLGISAIVPNEIKRGVIVADLVRIRINKIDIKYLCFALNSPRISNFINSKQKGTTRARVKLSIVRELPIPITSEKEQSRIVKVLESKFSVIDKVDETVNLSLIKAETLRKSILKNAFEGKLINTQEIKIK